MADLGMAAAPFGPKPNAFQNPTEQLAFPAASVNPGKTDLLGALQKVQRMKEIAAYLNRPQQSQMAMVAPTAPGQ